MNKIFGKCNQYLLIFKFCIKELSKYCVKKNYVGNLIGDNLMDVILQMLARYVLE